MDLLKSGIYIHIPFCNTKCHYCDFYSITDNSYHKKFLDALLKEIEIKSYEPQIKSMEFSTIYFGGGTPSLLSISMMELIFDQLQKNFKIKGEVEISIECNPGTIDKDKLKGYKNLGINRISLGVQSFILSELRFLQRIHSDKEPVEAVRMARAEGFENISLDLIYGIPGQTIDSWKFTLEQSLNLEPDHISAYNLIFEQGTPLNDDFLKGKVEKLIPESEAEMYETAVKILETAGYEHYEVSNYALNGKKCLHNKIYWDGGNYIGLGPSAHGFSGNIRYWNYRNMCDYLNSLKKDILPIESNETIDAKQRITELIMLGLRSEGINLKLLEKEFSIIFLDYMHPLIDNLVDNKLAIYNDGSIRLTNKGYLMSDEIIIRFIGNLEKKIKIPS